MSVDTSLKASICVYSTVYISIVLATFTLILKRNRIINDKKQLITMPRRCIAAGCDSVGGKGCSLHKFPQYEAIKKKWIKAVKQQRSNWDGPSPHSLPCSKHFADVCFVTEGIRFCDEMGLPMVKRLKPDSVATIFARSINFVQPSSASSTSIHKPTGWPLSEKC